MRNNYEKRAKTPKPLSLRLNFEQRAILEQEAEGLPVSTYIKKRLFGSSVSQKSTRIPRPIKDKSELGRLLGFLGQSSAFTNLQILADAANSGSLPLDPETHEALIAAMQDIRDIRDMLIRALGLRN